MNIPRYTASIPLQTEFITNSDGCGDNVFKQVKREGNICLYSRTKTGETTPWSYEVIITKLVKGGDNSFIKKDYETYTGSSGFGKMGWFYPNLPMAENKFNELLSNNSGGNTTTDSSVTKDTPQCIGLVTPNVLTVLDKKQSVYDKIPDGEFTQADFARLNGLPERGVVYNVIHSMINRGLIKENRRVQVGGRGRPTVMFIKS